MKTPQEKAEELIEKFGFVYIPNYTSNFEVKQCAIIAVEELIAQNGELYLNGLGDKTIEYYKAQNAYLFEVKQEIEKP